MRGKNIQLSSTVAKDLRCPVSQSHELKVRLLDQHTCFFLICFISNHHIKKLWLMKLKAPYLKPLRMLCLETTRQNQILWSQPCIINLHVHSLNKPINYFTMWHKHMSKISSKGRYWQRDVIPASTQMLSREASNHHKSD